MTTVTIIQSKDGEYKGFVCAGHAGYANSGRDIVCAAISVLVINTINSLDQLTKASLDVETEETDGYISCQFKEPLNEAQTLLMDSFVLGIEHVVDGYGSQKKFFKSKKYCELKFKEV